MTTYMITYDEHNGNDYNNLYKAIQAYGGYCHALESVWFIVSNDTPINICNNLQQHLNKQAKILVTKATAPGAWNNLDDEVTEWLQANL